MSSSGREDSSPVITLRTVPSVLRDTQVKQMPIRQPYSGVRPCSSAWSRIGAPVFVALVPVRVKAISPSADPVEVGGVLKNSVRSRGDPSYAAVTRSIIGAGPQAHVSVSR